MREFYQVRLMYYDKRKVHLVAKLTEEWEKLDNKVRVLFVLFLLGCVLLLSCHAFL